VIFQPPSAGTLSARSRRPAWRAGLAVTSGAQAALGAPGTCPTVAERPPVPGFDVHRMVCALRFPAGDRRRMIVPQSHADTVVVLKGARHSRPRMWSKNRASPVVVG